MKHSPPRSHISETNVIERRDKRPWSELTRRRDTQRKGKSSVSDVPGSVGPRESLAGEPPARRVPGAVGPRPGAWRGGLMVPVAAQGPVFPFPPEAKPGRLLLCVIYGLHPVTTETKHPARPGAPAGPFHLTWARWGFRSSGGETTADHTLGSRRHVTSEGFSLRFFFPREYVCLLRDTNADRLCSLFFT